MAKSKIFEEKYPCIQRFIEEMGSIEIGQDEMISSFVRAYDYGGTVYEGKTSYSNMSEAFEDLERAIKAYFDEIGI